MFVQALRLENLLYTPYDVVHGVAVYDTPAGNVITQV